MKARRAAKLLAASAATAVSLAFAGTAVASATPAVASATPAVASATPAAYPRQGARFGVHVVLNGARLRHTFIPAGSSAPRTEALADPDDITVLGHHLFSGFQNGVGPQGQPSTDGNAFSTIVEYTATGHVVQQWDIKGKCDGVTADTAAHLLIATVNEDANSSIYTITPGALPGEQVAHYRYNEPLPHFGGTDAISVYHNLVLISASAPGTTGMPAPQPTYPAAYIVTFNSRTLVATMHALFYDEAAARVANTGAGFGKAVNLALTDPDSNEIVPAGAPRFGGDFMLTSQGDEEQIFVQPHGGFDSHLWVLKLTHSVDDTAWARSASGKLYGDNTSQDEVEVVTGPFPLGSIWAAVTPCDENSAPATCPGPGYPPNYLGTLNPWTGLLTRVPLAGPSFRPQGMVFISPGWVVTPG
jgi:hypothetical protein